MQKNKLATLLAPFIAGIALLSTAPLVASAAPNFEEDAATISKNARCYVNGYKEDDIIRVDAGMYKHTFVRFPEEVLSIILGEENNKKNSLWDNRYLQTYLIIKPLSGNKLGTETTLTVVGASGRTYNVLATRKKHPETFCYRVVVEDNRYHPEVLERIEAQNATKQAAQNAQIAAITASKNKAVENVETQAREGLKKYRKSLNTNYRVTSSNGYFAPKGMIASVYDDGRFTYVRLSSDKKGLLSIFGEIDGKKEVLEFDYDSPSKTYTISGIFPKFILKASESEAVVESSEGGA